MWSGVKSSLRFQKCTVRPGRFVCSHPATLSVFFGAHWMRDSVGALPRLALALFTLRFGLNLELVCFPKEGTFPCLRSYTGRMLYTPDGARRIRALPEEQEIGASARP
jgi:hypothetical protein